MMLANTISETEAPLALDSARAKKSRVESFD